jgi:hypothetical protein
MQKFHEQGEGVTGEDGLATLLCLLQRSRPSHTSGEPDKLPFIDFHTANTVFEILDLPSGYFQVADGSLSLVHASRCRVGAGSSSIRGFEFIAYCVTKQGDWSMALRHQQSTRRTSVFWSLDKRIDSERLVEQMHHLQEYACHPMLLPCIMFEAILKTGLERRHTIKAHLRVLEHEVQKANRTAAASADRTKRTDDDGETCSNDLEQLFERLQSCRRAQASREGRYELWRSFQDAIAHGFQYCKEIPTSNNTKFAAADTALRQWFELTWTKFESLKARDKDHVERINNLSDVVCMDIYTVLQLIVDLLAQQLYNIVHLRDSRVQLDIALAAKRDSEDMKFITLLGAVFLPASLIAVRLPTSRNVGYAADHK